MNKTFLIDDRLVFDCDRNLLTSLVHSDLNEILNEPCARCLEALLNAQGKIVSQAELYKAGWGEGYKDVSPNTLYQNVLLARKAFRKVAEDNDHFIITVPRQGFRFNENIPVTVGSRAALPLSSPAENQPMAMQVENKNTPLTGTASHLLFKFIAPFSFLLIILAIALYAIGTYKYNNTYYDNFTEEYLYFQERSGCDIYINKQDRLSASEFEHLLNAWPIITSDCSTLPLRYVTAYRNHLSVFYLSCDIKDKADRICRSGYLRRSK